ncbi:DNA mismatch repair protein [Microcoleus sp. FACHB-831]|uniref:YbjN domain-containing protein n=1 Tax=Microcoleus sp. FACHB-831 TaxID=2692827 RepID=UPI001685EF0D|nr:YbjN domain-containing protein [Microcoleus sp. FACHB-831]MBD1922848.1 DNA mismatch repair protein [Microcoleus sp. FACHB-831]
MSDININEATAHPLAKFRNHLEFNGYNVQEQDDTSIGATHPRKVSLALTHLPDRGVYIASYFNSKPSIARQDMLEYINELNSQFCFIKAYIDGENNLAFDTSYEGDYDRKNFSIILENIDEDWKIFAVHKLTEKYLDY